MTFEGRLGNLKDSAFFPKMFPLFFGLFRPFSRIIPEKGRKQTGKKAENFPKKERNLLSFQVMTNCCSFSFFYEHTPLRMEHLIWWFVLKDTTSFNKSLDFFTFGKLTSHNWHYCRFRGFLDPQTGIAHKIHWDFFHLGSYLATSHRLTLSGSTIATSPPPPLN